jgi:hypothetical protein
VGVKKLSKPAEWVQISVVEIKGAPSQHKAGMKKVVVRNISDSSRGEED